MLQNNKHLNTKQNILNKLRLYMICILCNFLVNYRFKNKFVFKSKYE
jgi:hypothetical protein